MPLPGIKSKNNIGFTLVEVLVSILIVTTLVLSVYKLIDFSIKITADNKHRVAATVISNQKMERIRNLPYASVGTLSGLVQGVLPDNEVITQGENSYSVIITVRYEDDSFDGTDIASGGTDTIPTDYKTVNITVGWSGSFGEKNITASSIISPRGLETDAGGGTLAISVFDASGLPVENADVHVENNLLNPVVNFNEVTNSDGLLVFYGAPTSTEGYEISVTKTGYSKSSTTPRTINNPNPTIPHASVFEDQKTDISFAIDLLGVLNIRTIQQDLPDNWRINTGVDTEDQTKPDIAIDGNGNFYFIWQDYRNGSAAKIYAQKYDSSYNAVWAEDKVIGSANNQIEPAIVAENDGSLYVAWNDDSNGNQDVYYLKIDSSGNDVWGGAKKLNNDASNKDQTAPSIALSESGGTATTTVAWQDNRNNNWDIYINKFDENGTSVWSAEVLANSDSGITDQYSPKIITDSNDYTYVVWTDERNGDKDIYAQKFDLDGNKLWGTDLKINNDSAAADQYYPAMTIDSNDNFYITWTDERNGDKDIYAQKFDLDGNLLWNSSDVKINSDSTTKDQYSPALAVDCSGNIYFTWTDERDGDSDIYAQKLDSNGNKYWTDDIRININNDTSNQSSPQVTINPATCEAYACWYDERNGEYDIFASKIEPYGSINALSNIPLTITGTKKIGENPIIYKFEENHTTDSIGYIHLNNMEYDSYAIELESGYSDYSVVMSIPANPVSLDPSETKDITLYLEP